MDNNLINIDDLVRQRLGGGQEPERSGSWQRMQELLEKDDRRKPAGFYWKRTMMYCGVAMLLAAVSVGGFEATSAFRASADVPSGAQPTGSVVATGTANTGSSVATSSVSGNSSANSASANSGNGVASAKHNGSSVASGSASAAHATHASGNTVAANTTVSNSEIAGGTKEKIAAHSSNNTLGNAVHNTADQSIVSANKNIDHTNATASNKITTTNRVATTTDNTINTTDKHGAAHNNTNSPSVKNNVFAAAPTTATPSVASAKNATITGHANKADGTTAKTSATNFASAPLSAKPVTANTTASVKPNNTAVTQPATNATVSKNNAAAVTDHGHMVVKPIAGKQVIERIVMHERPTTTYQGVTEHKLDTISVDQITMELSRRLNNEDGDAANELVAKTSAGVAAAPSPSTTNTTNGTNLKAKGGNATSTTPAGNNLSANKTNITGTTSTNNTVAANKQTGNTPVSGNQLAAKPTTANNEVAAILPNAAMPESAAAPAPPAENKQVNLAKKKHGSNMAESLSSMFNEIKYKLNGVQFAPGLTAGINGTFFGPNSFKGFQFGFTGAFELDDKWSFMAELKYFHRMNNNYAMYDNYNKYQTTAGGFFKDSTERTYSFSTLHSFELPLSIRYAAGKFSFFGGANVVYTMAVNTGAAEQLIDPSTRPIVTTATENATPALNDNDFRARFGMGYVCGISYKVAPNLTFDFRSAQTVWDNAKTTGAQTVSGQLYKSPSLQFSLFYRLGKIEPKD